MIKLYNTWEKVKDTFVKPSLKVYFGKWKNDPNLPVWRGGPSIWLVRKQYRFFNNSKVYTVKDSTRIYTGEVPYKFGDKEYKSKCYEWAPKHKLPGKLKAGDHVWNRNIRKKLKKWHLSWIPPVIKLPSWTRFYIINYDVDWKTKWGYARYEYPPQFSIIAFGLSLTFTLHCPIKSKYSSDDSYWESILTHLYFNQSGELKETIEQTGIWRRFNDDTYYFALRPTYIVHDKQPEYYAATSEIKVENADKTVL